MRLDVSGGGCWALAAETSRGMHTAAVGASACAAGLRRGKVLRADTPEVMYDCVQISYDVV
jgi:hypothetical protein